MASTVARRTAIRYASPRSVIAPWPMTQLPPPSSAPAGWYSDPDGRPGSRYFDGHRWAPPTNFGLGTDHTLPTGLAAPVAPALGCGRCTCNPLGIVGRRPVVDRRAVAFRVAAHRVRRAADGGRVRTFTRVVLVRQPSLGDRAAERRRGAAVPLERRRLGSGHLDRGAGRADRRRRAHPRVRHPADEQHRARLGHRRQPRLRHRACHHRRRGSTARRGDGVPRGRDARATRPVRRGRDGRPAGGVLRFRPLRPGAGHEATSDS